MSEGTKRGTPTEGRMLVACVYCGAQEEGNEGGRCATGLPHCFLIVTPDVESGGEQRGFPE